MDEREARLPAWAREVIADLRRRVQCATGQLTRELSRLRPQVEKLAAENNAMRELMQAAARGGHMGASEIVRVIDEYKPWSDDEVSLDSVLGRGRHEDDSGVDLGRAMP